MTNLSASAATRWQLPRMPYSWTPMDAIGGIMLGDGTFAAIGATVYQDDTFLGYGRLVRILSASSTTDGAHTWVTVQRLDSRTGRSAGPRHSRADDTQVLYSPSHLWRSQELATYAGKERAKGNHRIGVDAVVEL